MPMENTDDIYDIPPDPAEMEQVMKDMTAAWAVGSDYIAPNNRVYFRYALPLLDMGGAKRFGGVEHGVAPDGKPVMIDSYRAPNGKILRVGYYE
jgi:hypothetical protein